MSELPKWLDGPMLFDFVMKKAPQLVGQREGVLGETLSRTMSRWRSGEHAHYATADRLLTQLGIHLSEVPEEMWRWSRSDKKHLGIKHLKNGHSKKQVAEWMGVAKRTVETWQTEISEDKAA
jgi:hypothetical protein